MLVKWQEFRISRYLSDNDFYTSVAVFLGEVDGRVVAVIHSGTHIQNSEKIVVWYREVLA